ncbi:helix-turn-helix domain-containing protein [Caloranaerobacter azorensis]|uniref:DNA-binding transcriptional regulator, XRE-family HTH domain n=1 Tax=Caloranaerobacter azorensis DSM 13643 TaxID=1121264 RepID=A0A1M5TTV9_9FIRM|nr:helix-turn-helix transcriptional regulator [Caloranaerobacter azorensis]SHH54108.1 DNA-binding transcriptional regulator, XRE-family HTH domain [Caloranaerobacter azorensis DSM 13643]
MLGQRLKYFRNKLGLTQQTIADKADIDVTMISKIENEKAKPSLQTLKRIAQALEVDISDLLKETEQSA